MGSLWGSPYLIFAFKVNFGSQILETVILSAVGCLAGTSLGTLVGVSNKKSEGFREDLGYDPKQVYQMGRVVEFLERYMGGKDTYAEVLKSKQREKLLAFKKGSLTLPEAEQYMNQEVVRVNALVDTYLKQEHKVNKEVEELLREVQYNVMKIYMKEVMREV